MTKKPHIQQISRKEANKILEMVPFEKRFRFADEGGNVELNFEAWSLSEFCDQFELVSPMTVELHASLGDFEEWFRDVIKDHILADEIAKVIRTGTKGEELKNKILEATKARCAQLTVAAEIKNDEHKNQKGFSNSE